MKILITGYKGYIGRNLKKYFEINSVFQVEMVSVRKSIPKDLTAYDAIIHLAAIVHKNEKKYTPKEYYTANTLLTKKLATQARFQGVKHFIFLSTMAIYGLEGEIDRLVVIDEKTEIKPKSLYGKSKYAAEKHLKKLEKENFKISIIRAPMVYGENCPGNYSALKKFAEHSLIFPDINNKRSMLHIDNLCQLALLILENKKDGIFFPQNREYVCTSRLVMEIAAKKGHTIFISKNLGKLLTKIDNKYLRKIFGNLVYDMKISNHFDKEYMLRV